MKRALLGLGAVGLVAALAAADTTYTYDALGRVTNATYDDGSSVQYQHDAAGNRTTVTATSATSPPPPPPGCGGFEFAGYCYYASDLSASCDAVCSSHGGCDLAGTQHIGSSGTSDSCETVASAVGYYAPDYEESTMQGVGCVWRSTGGGILTRFTSPATSCSASMSNRRRICACDD